MNSVVIEFFSKSIFQIMGLFKKIILLAIIIGIIYYGYEFVGLGKSDLERIQIIDKNFQISQSKLVPGSEAELKIYEDELTELNNVSREGKNVIEIKLALVEMQRAMQTYTTFASQIDYQNPNCTFTGPVFNAKNQTITAIASANTALEGKQKIRNLKGFSYLTSSKFDDTLQSVISSLENSKLQLEVLC